MILNKHGSAHGVAKKILLNPRGSFSSGVYALGRFVISSPFVPVLESGSYKYGGHFPRPTLAPEQSALSAIYFTTVVLFRL